ASEYIAKIAGGNGEGDRPVRRAEGDGGSEVIDDLRQNPRPVDGVDSGKANAVAEGVVVEHGFDQRLAVVEIAFDRNGVHVRGPACGHLPLLNRGNTAM